MEFTFCSFCVASCHWQAAGEENFEAGSQVEFHHEVRSNKDISGYSPPAAMPVLMLWFEQPRYLL